MPGPSLEVLDPGLLTVVRDRGRSGLEALGIPRDGALDYHAYMWANRLAMNEPPAAALEAMLRGFTIVVSERSWLATTGASPIVDGRERPPWSGFWVRAGATVALAHIAGARAYLSLHGGIAVEPVLGSRSTDLESGFGGYRGRALRRGDVLPIGDAPAPPYGALVSLRCPSPPDVARQFPVRVVLGPRDDEFTAEAVSAFLISTFRVSPQSNHMGLRLDGPTVSSAPRGSRVSEPMPVGGIQITPDGRPIVLLASRGTIGGYPLIATVITPDVWRLGQARPGNTLTFRSVSIEEAQAMAQSARADLAGISPVTRFL